MEHLFSIKGKKVILTGGAGGLGLSIAKGLLDAGAIVSIIDISNGVYDIVDQFSKDGLNAYAVQGNMGNEQSLQECYCKAIKCLEGEVDILFNLAGIQKRHHSEDFPLEDWQAVLDINLTSTFLMSQLVARNMIKRGEGGKIINIASMLSFFGGYTVPAYAASKGGVAQLTKALGNEWIRYGINVNALAPGYMDTAMNTQLLLDEARNQEILARIPANRWGTGNDMIGPALFLASNASNYLSGAIIPVDGGYLCR